MRAGGGGGEREPGVREAAHVDEVEGFVGLGVFGGFGLGCVGPGLFAFEALVQLSEAAGDAHVHTRYEVGFGCVRGGDDHAGGSGPAERVDEGEGSHDGADGAVEAELAEHADAVEHAGGQPAVGTRERKRDCELEAGPALAYRCGREVHRDAFHGVGQAGREQRGANAFARFASGRVGEADDRVAGQAARHVDFHGHDATDHTFEHCAVHRSEHATTSSSGRDRGVRPRSRSVVRRS